MTFAILTNIPVPARTIPNAGPRETKYPLDDMEQGQAFAISVDSEKQARQKQSQFSSLAKSRHIKLTTRYIPVGHELAESFGDVKAPLLAVWHDGVAVDKPAKAKKAAAVAAPNAPVAEEIEL